MKHAEVYLTAGILLALTGACMVMNDAGDIGSFDHPEGRVWKGVDFSWLPVWVHHWWIGILILLLGLYIIYRTSPYAHR